MIIEENLIDLKNINSNRKKKKKNKEINSNSKNDKNDHMMHTYVDEDSIYLCNIFEEKKNLNKLKNSKSDENIFGRLNKKMAMTMNDNNKSNFYTNFSHLNY